MQARAGGCTLADRLGLLGGQAGQQPGDIQPREARACLTGPGLGSTNMASCTGKRAWCSRRASANLPSRHSPVTRPISAVCLLFALAILFAVLMPSLSKKREVIAQDQS